MNLKMSMYHSPQRFLAQNAYKICLDSVFFAMGGSGKAAPKKSKEQKAEDKARVDEKTEQSNMITQLKTGAAKGDGNEQMLLNMYQQLPRVSAEKKSWKPGRWTSLVALLPPGPKGARTRFSKMTKLPLVLSLSFLGHFSWLRSIRLALFLVQ